MVFAAPIQRLPKRVLDATRATLERLERPGDVLTVRNPGGGAEWRLTLRTLDASVTERDIVQRLGVLLPGAHVDRIGTRPGAYRRVNERAFEIEVVGRQEVDELRPSPSIAADDQRGGPRLTPETR